MTAPTVYYSDDAGAPVLTNGQDAFYQVLKACLIDGYGSKAAAGWSVVYDDWAASGHASFTNAGQSGVLGLVRAATVDYPPFMYVAEAMIDALTAVNARSGERAIADISTDFIEGSSEVTQRPVSYKTHYPYWCVVANENFAWVWMSSHDTVFTTAISNSVVSTVGFGAVRNFRGLGSPAAPQSGNFVIFGGANTERIAALNAYGFFNSAGIFTNYSSTVFYGLDGQILDGGGSYCFWPFFIAAGDNRQNGVGEQDDSIIELPLLPCSVWLLTDGQSNTRYGNQVCAMAGVYANPAACLYDDWLDRMFVGDLKTEFNIAGKTFLKVRLTNNVAFLSLDASDWA
ncbi:MAG: hypothetical protein ABNH16_06935 [Thalassolituus sp.]|jgi:hypothetical protein